MVHLSEPFTPPALVRMRVVSIAPVQLAINVPIADDEKGAIVGYREDKVPSLDIRVEVLDSTGAVHVGRSLTVINGDCRGVRLCEDRRDERGHCEWFTLEIPDGYDQAIDAIPGLGPKGMRAAEAWLVKMGLIPAGKVAE